MEKGKMKGVACVLFLLLFSSFSYAGYVIDKEDLKYWSNSKVKFYKETDFAHDVYSILTAPDSPEFIFFCVDNTLFIDEFSACIIPGWRTNDVHES